MADVDSSGRLDLSELRTLFANFGHDSDEVELKRIFDTADMNKDGELDDKEFIELIKYLMQTNTRVTNR